MNLQMFRKEHGYSRKQIADKLKISFSLYEKIEYGIRKPSQKFLYNFKSAFPDFDMNIFFTDTRAGDDEVGKSRT